MGVEVFKTCKKTRYISWSNGYWSCSNVTIGAEQKAAKKTRYIDEVMATLQRGWDPDSPDADQYIYDAGGKIAFGVFKIPSQTTLRIFARMFTLNTEPVPTTPGSECAKN